MKRREAHEGPAYESFQEFVEKHPSPARVGGENQEADQRRFGAQLAQRFLSELRESLAVRRKRG